MRLAFLIRHRRRLLMQLDPTITAASSSSSATNPIQIPTLKRSFAQQATATSQSPSQQSHSKFPKFESKQRPLNPFEAFKKSSESSSNKMRRNRQSKSSKNDKPPSFELPVHDRDYVTELYESKLPTPLKRIDKDFPKSALGNFCATASIGRPDYKFTQGHFQTSRETYWRAQLTIQTEPPLITFGDSPSKKDAEYLAALSAACQLQMTGLLEKPPKQKIETHTKAELSDGTEISYELARSFMDYYCRKYGFGSPDITYAEIKGKAGRSSTWEAVMTVGGRRIGLGSAIAKKSSMNACYLDVAQYLEKCDPDLWKEFTEARKTGQDLGLAPKIYFSMSDRLDDEIRDLCTDIKKSDLYKKRPAIGSGKTGSDGAAEVSVAPVRYGMEYKRPSAGFLGRRSEDLLHRRKQYLEDPLLATMRDTRMSLPVYTRSEDVLSHIRDNDVTICMAATGSGKTTQIPQLILDEYIDKGVGALCNVVCTQPRRLAAISVAARVANERGQELGREVGYQVRFEARLPEAHGSITFCTTGIFLKRLQSALSDSGNPGQKGNLDDVTHVVVDEVHERDVDTDLLLVVLKRLLADRKAKGKPLKIVLMSATIDPSLFQNYFPDDNDKPATVTEIPGRSFPVTKYFLDDYIPYLRKGGYNWVFNHESVAKYLQKEISPLMPSIPQPTRSSDDLDLPFPLIALTICHVLQRTDSGHVLVFLPGWEEIMSTQRMLLSPLGPLPINFSNTNNYTIHLLHSTIPLADQQVVFEPPPAGVRRIILATNIAETSITIPDVVYVVDTAKIKEQQYDPERHMSSLVSAWVGSSNLNQRAGRAGRHRSGEYFGILGRNHAEALAPYQTVEMKRVDLSNVVMHVKALDFPGMAVEEVLAATIEPPAPQRVIAAMKDLQMVGALDDQNRLTSLGRVLLQLPVEVQMGRLVLFGSFFRCLDQALTLAAILTNRDPFLSPMHLKQESGQVRLSWSPPNFKSDPLATLQAYNAWWELQGSGNYSAANRFCNDNFLSKPTLMTIQKIKGHLLQALYHAGVLDVSAGGNVGAVSKVVPPELNANGDSLPLLAALIAVACQPKFAIRTGERSLRTAQDKMTFIHPSSVNNRKHEVNPESGEKQLYAFTEKRQNVSTFSSGTPQMYLMQTTRLDPMTYMLFGASKIQVTDRGVECDGWLPIVGNLDALDDVQRLKTLMESCMLRVFEGIIMGRRQNTRNLPILAREEVAESESDDDEEIRDLSLSRSEVKELDLLTRDIVRIMNGYAEERFSSQSRQTSRPATPMSVTGTPRSAYGIRSLPNNNWSGTSTPAYNSRPGTPSRLGRPF